MQLKENELQQDVEAVRATFDQIGALFATNTIPKKPLLKAPGEQGESLGLPCAKYFH